VQYILTVQGLTFQNRIVYPPMEIPQAQATFISGDSGSGKTTLFRMINATLTPSGGVITYQGQNIVDLDTVRLRRELLLMSQTVFLFDATIRSNFEAFFAYRDQTPPTDNDMIDYLRLCCADFPLDTRCETLSGGERQRVFLAIHMSLAPTVLLLDEPTSALDETTAHRMLQQVKAHCRAKGITLLVICHDSKITEAFADKTIVLAGRASA
jgi:putative ABC transport system ATP-binding protein